MIYEVANRRLARREFVLPSEHDMMRVRQPCRTRQPPGDCLEFEAAPNLNILAIAWRDNRTVVLMAAVVSSSSNGSIMGSVRGYLVGATDGIFLSRLVAADVHRECHTGMSGVLSLP